MKNLFAFIAIFGMLFFAASTNIVIAQEEEVEVVNLDSNQVVDETATADTAATTAVTEEEEVVQGTSMHQQVKKLFIEGGALFMSFILIALILGLALSIERIIYLNMASTNTTKLLKNVESALDSGGIEAAKEVCRNTRGPVASIFYQGLDRYVPGKPESIENVEKSVIAYGGVQMGLLERNLSWIALFIAIGPMLGFMGTVLGMIEAFDQIEIAGDVSPSLVAGGIKIALITTVAGLIVAMILQIFYNYFVSKIDSIVNKMEDASISLIDILVKYNLKN